MKVRTLAFTSTTTRTEALLEQFEIFLQYAGVSAANRTKILDALDERAIEAVGVYRVRDGRRVEEIELHVSWTRHSDHVTVSPRFSTELPGWEGGAAPEVLVVARRFGQAGGPTPRYWVRFTSKVRSDEQLHRRWCRKVGVVFGGSPPAWRSRPDERRYGVQDMDEATTIARKAR